MSAGDESAVVRELTAAAEQAERRYRWVARIFYGGVVALFAYFLIDAKAPEGWTEAMTAGAAAAVGVVAGWAAGRWA